MSPLPDAPRRFRRFRPALVASLAVCLAIVVAACGPGFRRDAPRVLVLGMDGLDHKLVRQWMNEGKLPNFARLRDAGGFRPLTTSIPPESPVAWSNVVTGMNPGGHGVKDFFLLDPTRMDLADGGLRDSISKTEGHPNDVAVLGYKVPLPWGQPVTENTRGGTAFWQVLEGAGVRAVVNRMPANFPPVETAQRTLTGMGTPGLEGSVEQYTLFSDNLPPSRLSASGGRMIQVYPDPFDPHLELELPGPDRLETPKPVDGEKGPDGKPRKEVPMATVPLDVYYDVEAGAAKIVIDDEETVLVRVGEWSDWVTVTYELFPLMVNAQGICRFLLQELEPDFRLYVSTVQFDPRAPAAAISTPGTYAAELADGIGTYHTKGLPVEYKALKDGALRLPDFIGQMEQLREEELAILKHELGRFESGLLFCYFSHTDLPVHNLWNLVDRDSPTFDSEASALYGETIESIYRGADRALGDVLGWLEDNPDVTLLVLSDHGMAGYRRSVHLNHWLHSEGYLALKEGLEPGPSVGYVYDSIDWNRTRAYGFGFAGIFLNLEGREEYGIVARDDANALLEEIRGKLLALEDAEASPGRPVFKYVYRADEVYDGPYADDGPDLVVGPRRGWRVSDGSASGDVAGTLFEDNESPWSGDHAMAHDEVPGILFSNRPIAAEAPALYDVTATILDAYGIEKTEGMIGSSVFR